MKSEKEKIVLPQRLQEQMMKFFLQSSIRRNKNQKPLTNKNTDKGVEK